MHPLEKKVKKNIVRHGLINSGELILVGVSAGPDSLALLHALHALMPGLGFSLMAVYVDHGLRLTETAGEEQLVVAAAKRLGVPWRCGKVMTESYARRHGLSLEHAARDLRYDFFAKLSAEIGARRVAVAHTADDQAEELLLRLLRGTARGGLSGMAPLSRNWIIRPMLTVSKDEVLAYLKHRDLVFAEDSSNRDLRFTRNRVRLELFPWLKERFNPNLRETLCHTALVLRDEESLLESLAETAYSQARTRAAAEEEKGARGCGGAEGAGEKKGEVELDLAIFSAQPRALQRRILEKALLAMGLRPTGRVIEQLLHGAKRGRSGIIGHLALGVAVAKDSRRLLFFREAGGPRRRSGQ